MKITLEKVVNSVEGLNALLVLKLPIKIAYRVAKLVNGQISSELKAYNEARNKLIADLGEKDPKSDNIQVKPENIQEFREKITELLAEEVELNFEPIDLAELGDIQIEPRQIVEFIFK